VDRRPISEPPEHMKPDLKSVIRRGDTVIGAVHKQVVVTLVERKSGYALMAKVSNKTSDLVSQAIITKLNVVTPLVKTLTFDNGKKFAEHARIDRVLQSITYFADPFASL
jgi:IS30 family transposase